MFVSNWDVYAGEVVTEAKWNQLGNNDDYLYSHRVASGVICIWSGSVGTIPEGWVLCDGNNSTPDLRGRFIVGAGDAYSVDDTGGSDNVTLTTSQIPSHSHSVSQSAHSHGVSDPGHTHAQKGRWNASNVLGGTWYAGLETNNVGTTGSSHTGISINSANANITIASAGGGTSHENRPPYYALCYIQKT